MKAYTADKLYFNDVVLTNHGIIIDENGKINEIIENDLIPSTITKQNYPIISSSFIDIQIYGAYNKLFAMYPTADSLSKLHQYCVSGGASHFQPTIATNSYDVFYECIDAVKNYWEEGGKGCIGLHIEGPWISKVKRGAHIEEYVIENPLIENVLKLLEYGKDVITTITIAPEVCNEEIIRLIKSFGIIISAGHSNATFDEATDAFNSGNINTATHLFNAMSALNHRAPGMVGAIFNHSKIMSSCIPDGYHVDFSVLKIAKKQLKNRLFVITDAVTETKGGPYPHHLVVDKYESLGILSGSALTMSKSLKNLVKKVDIDLQEALNMCSLYPAQAICRDNIIGKIEVGYDVNIVMLDSDLEVIKVIYT
jgi:N-acetylglucosamine-6-phosphate deacetylase